MLKFLSTWLGAAAFSVAAIVLPIVLGLAFLQSVASTWTVAERTNITAVITDTPIVLMVLYWPWFLIRRAKSTKTRA